MSVSDSPRVAVAKWLQKLENRMDQCLWRWDFMSQEAMDFYLSRADELIALVQQTTPPRPTAEGRGWMCQGCGSHQFPISRYCYNCGLPKGSRSEPSVSGPKDPIPAEPTASGSLPAAPREPSEKAIRTATGFQILRITELGMDAKIIRLDAWEAAEILRAAYAVDFPAAGPSPGEEPSEVWTSTNPEVASVTPTGVITGVAAGRCTIHCHRAGGKYQTINLEIWRG